MRKRPRCLWPILWSWFVPSAFVFVFAAALVVLPLRARQYPQKSSEASSEMAQPPSAGKPDRPAARAPAGQADLSVPASFTLPAGTLISVRTEQLLSSDKSRAGDSFSADLAQPVVVGGWVVARRGQPVIGTVSVVRQAGHLKGSSKLGLALTTLVLADGSQFPITTRLIESASASGTPQRAVGILGPSTVIGAVIGAAAGDGEGAGIGAAIGAGAGLAGLLLSRGRPTVIPPESLLTFQLQSPLTFSTEGSEQAFQPVTQADYAPAEPALSRRGRQAATRPYPPYPPQPYYWPYAYPGWVPGWGYDYGYSSPFFIGFYGYGGGFHRDDGRFLRRDRR